MSKKYHSGNRCRYLLKVHLILVVKYRKRLLTGSMDEDLKQVLFDISKESDFSIEMMESDKDHIHMLLDYPPSLSLSSIVNRLKSMSTNRIWKRKATELKKEF